MMSSRISISRRAAVQTLSAGLAGLTGGVFSSLAPRRAFAANDLLQIACIGVANRAAANVGGVAAVPGAKIVALCDIDDTFMARHTKPLIVKVKEGDTEVERETPARFPDVRTYADYRELLDKENGRVDAVVVSTADHHHAPATIRALRGSMHVYCEKPLTHTVAEARLIAEEAVKAGVATQLGTQIHAGDNYRRVVEIIRAGTIGPVQDVHVWVGKAWGGDRRPEGGEKPPATLHWDLWLGPAPERPYVAGAYHPGNWRRFWDFGNGTLGDMGCHFMDLPFWALDLQYPTVCAAEGAEVDPDTCPTGLVVRYEFPARGDQPPVKLTWYDGTRIPTEVAGRKVPGNGVMFVGRDGMLFADYHSYRLFPAEKFAGFTPPSQSIPKSIGHYAEWIAACREGTPTTCHFGYSGPLTEAVLLGAVAYRAGTRLEWDAATLSATACPEAGRFIRKEYRPGWEVA
jgi:predicted dehydrogenase